MEDLVWERANIFCPPKQMETNRQMPGSECVGVIFHPIRQSSLPQVFNSVMDLERCRNDKGYTEFYEVRVIWTIEEHSLFFDAAKHGAPLVVQVLVHQLSLSL